MAVGADDVLKAVPILISGSALVWSMLQYRLGARKAELTELRNEIAAVERELSEHKSAGQDSRAELDHRLAQVEVRLDQLPDKDSLHKLALEISDIKGSVNTQAAELKGVTATARRIEEFLIDNARSGK